MTLNGIDVSYWQAADLSKVPYDFLIARATWGDGINANGFVDEWCDRHIQTAIKRGKLFGFYHFMTTHDAVQQARWFVQNTKNYFGHGIPVLDYEDIGNGVERAASHHGDAGALKFLNEVHRLTGVRPLVYANSSHAAGLHKVAAADYGLWVANWGQNAAGGYRVPPKPSSGPFPFVVIHQYTSRGRLAGYNGDLDLDIAHIDKAAWAKYANPSGESKPAPKPTPDPKPTPKPSSGTYAVQRGDSLSGIGAKLGVPWQAIYDANRAAIGSNPNHIVSGQVLKIPTGGGGAKRTYTVQRGDTLSGIAAKYGTTWQALQRANGIADANLIHPGQVLTIP